MYTVLPESDGNVLGLEIAGKIDIEQERELISKVEAILAEHDKISLLVVVNKGVSASFEAAVADLKWLVTNIKKLEKIAIVADNTLLEHLTNIDAKFAKLVGIGEKYFPTNELDAAWQWIK